MAKNDANGSRKKPTSKKKPDNQQHKTVYFNTDNINDKELFKYAQSVGVRNFSGWVKSLIYQEKVRRNGVPPNPYEYVSVGMDPVVEEPRTVPVRVKPIKEDKPAKIEVDEEDTKAIKVSIGDKKYKVEQSKRVDLDDEEEFEDNILEDKEELESNLESEGEDEQEIEEEAPPQRSVRASAAAAMASMYKRNN